MEQAKQFFERYQQANREQRAIVIKEYQSFLETLNNEDRQAARTFMQAVLRPHIDETVNELDRLAEKADVLLKNNIAYPTVP